MVAEINEEIQCSECSKVFFNEDNALEHFGTHSKIENKNQPKNSTEKLAAKEIFGKFSNENVMGTGKEISLNKSIDDLQIQSDEAKPKVCEICSKSFPLQKSLNYHMTSTHSEENIQNVVVPFIYSILSSNCLTEVKLCSQAQGKVPMEDSLENTLMTA